ncbi:elongation of very long chain fatty acids protein 4-like isoform X2 [Aphis craccivora]|uniref:Elongation of very long chain fatty acids protein 4-like isoform X2 n=1 Tax=Aphis craccivora TaxID=307492 RepID=A0A6G0YKQ4_APHCR|nr:elongation of very long chain fatty acids protein 4-like isoform X2 [Aphis craccivora]
MTDSLILMTTKLNYSWMCQLIIYVNAEAETDKNNFSFVTLTFINKYENYMLNQPIMVLLCIQNLT